jgi:acyl-CoA thioesterase-1
MHDEEHGGVRGGTRDPAAIVPRVAVVRRASRLPRAAAFGAAVATAALGCGRDPSDRGHDPPSNGERARPTTATADPPAGLDRARGATSPVEAVPGASPADGGAEAPGAGSASQAPAAEPAAPERRAPRLVLHAGDSMVGGAGGLSRALEQRYRAAGSRFLRDVWERVSIVQFAQQPRFRDLVRKHRPDVVVLTLGANDVFIPHPNALAKHVEAIAKAAVATGAECYWVGPPLWKGDKGLTAMLAERAAPCRFFDSGALTLERKPDGIHPSDRGGEAWAAAFWEFYEAAPTALPVARAAPPLPGAQPRSAPESTTSSP